MPVSVHAEIRRISQKEFGGIAYDVMKCVFAIHNEMGRFFNERIYRDAIANRFRDAQTEVRVVVRFEDFVKTYFIDLLIGDGAVFELKTVAAIHPSHRAQLLNYLFLAELSHGKLINLQPELVEHEFVNNSLTVADRTRFDVDKRYWREAVQDRMSIAAWLESMLRHLGTGLDLHLYEDALTHFLGGEEHVLQDIEIIDGTGRLGTQQLRLAAPEWAFKITAIPQGGQSRFEDHARRFLRHAQLQGIQWINIRRGRVTMTSIEGRS